MKRYIIVPAILVIAASLLWFIVPTLCEPRYGGRGYRYWMQLWETSGGTSPEAKVAMRGMGSRVIPLLLRDLSWQSSLREKYIQMNARLPRAMYELAPSWRDHAGLRRETAAAALGEIGPAASNAIPILIAAITQSILEPFSSQPNASGVRTVNAMSISTNVRIAAIRSLGKIAPEDAHVVDALVDALRQITLPHTKTVAFGAMEVLTNLAPQFKDRIPAMLTNLRQRDQTQYRGGISSCGISSLIYHTAPYSSKAAVPGLIGLLNATNAELREAAAYDLAHLRPNAKEAGLEAVPALLQALKDPDPEVRINAAEAILDLDPGKARACVPSLIELLEVGDSIIPLRAVDGLRLAGPAAIDALPALQQKSGRQNALMRLWSDEAMTSIQGKK